MRASRTVTFSNVSQLADDDAIKTSVASSTSAVVYTGADLDGAAVSDGVARPVPNDHAGLASYPSVTTTAQSGAYEPGSKVTFVGTYGTGIGAGPIVPVERTAVISEPDGGETAFADGPLDSVFEIRVEPQADTDGALSFGFSGLAPLKGQRFIQLEGAAEGEIHVGYGDHEDKLLTDAGRKHECMPTRIFADTTAIFTLYLE